MNFLPIGVRDMHSITFIEKRRIIHYKEVTFDHHGPRVGATPKKIPRAMSMVHSDLVPMIENVYFVEFVE